MGLAVVKVAAGGLPVTIASTGGLPCTEATNGFGIAVTEAPSGAGGLAVTGFVFGPTIALSASSVSEAATVNTTVGTLSVTSGTTGTPVFTLADSASGKFNISGTTLRTNALLDYETASSHSITVAVSGVTPSVANKVFVIGVTNVVATTPVAPELDLTSAASDNTPDFTLTGDLVLGDTVRFQYSTAADFTGASELTNAIDAGEDAANTISFSTGALSNATWYFRARIERAEASNSDWSNTETITIVSASATTWNSGDKTSNLTLSNSNRTVAFNGASNANAGLRSVAASVSNQKIYIEHVVGTILSASGFGFADSAAAISTGPNAAFASPSHAFGVSTSGNFVCQDSPQTTFGMIAALANGDRVGIAFNTQTGKVWTRKNGGAWMTAPGGAQDPAAGTGGYDVPFAGPYYAWAGLDANVGDVFTTNFASSNWVDAAPAGFTQLAV